jgi:hypothetical protein
MPVPNVPRSSRTESVEDKLTLLRHAYEAKRFNLAESIKDSIQYDRQTNAASVPTKPAAGDFLQVGDLPQAWAA